MKPRLLLALLITMVISAGAQEKSSAQTPNIAKARLPRQEANSSPTQPKQTQEPLQSRDGKGSQRSSDAGEGTIVVNVWSTAPSDAVDPEDAKDNKLSPSFAVAALNATTKLQFTERRIENSIRKCYPLSEFWIQTDLDAIDDSLRVAALTATNEADRQALQQMENQAKGLRDWCDWLLDEYRHLHLANYYTSPSALDNDERFQNTVACTRFLLSMLGSGKLAEENSCR